MYALKLRNYACGCFDLGGGDYPCTTCKWFVGLDTSQNPKGFQENVVGYQCGRYLSIDGNIELTCSEARRDELICGIDGKGWQDNPPQEPETRFVIDAAVSSAHCDDCTHCMPWGFREKGKPLGAKTNLSLCARYVLPVSGAPIPCIDARSDPSICGPDGVGFEVPVVPERDLPTLERAPELRFHAPPVESFQTDAVYGSGGCVDCKHARIDIRDPLNPADDVLVCTRYVDPVSGAPIICLDVRRTSGACGVDGAGFEPIEEAA